MAEKITLYRIFVASPSDLAEDRRLIRKCLFKYNQEQAIHDKVIFYPVYWEATNAGIGNPQSTIDLMLDNCDYMVLLLWRRWGSETTSDGDCYSSGTEEEFRRAMSNYRNPVAPMKDILVLFRDLDTGRLAEIGPQMKKVRGFRKSLEEGHEVFFKTYESEGDVLEILRQHLAVWLRNHIGGAKKITGREKWEFSPFQNRHIEHIPFPGESLGADPELVARLEAARGLSDGKKISEAEFAYESLIAETQDVNAKNDFAKFLYRIGKRRKAEQYFTDILTFALATNNLGWQSRAEANLAIIARSLGDLDRARSRLEQSLRTNRQFGHKAGVADNLRHLAGVKRLQGNIDAALEHAQEALSLFEELRYKPGIADTCADLGVSYRIRCDYTRARAYYRRSLELNEELERPGCIADAYGRIGTLERLIGNLDSALDYYIRAKDIDVQLERKHGLAQDLGHLGVAMLEAESYDRAREYLSRAEELSRELSNKEMLAKQLAGFGRLLLMAPADESNRGDVLLQAQGHLSEAMELNVAMGAKEGIAAVSQLFAEYFLRSPRVDYAEAEVYAKQAMRLWDELGCSLGVAESLETLGFISAQKGDVDSAIQFALRSARTAHEVGARVAELSARMLLCSMLKLANDVDGARREYGSARQLGEEINATEKLRRLREHCEEFVKTGDVGSHNGAKAYTDVLQLVIRQTALVKVTLDRDGSTFTRQDEHILTQAIRERLKIGNDVLVVHREGGSVKITFVLERSSAEKLVRSVKNGEFLDLDVRSSEIIEESAVKAIIEDKIRSKDYDVFLCHNSADKEIRSKLEILPLA